MKLFRSLKSRFILLFALLIAVICAVSSILGVWQLNQAASEIFASQGVFVAERAASLVNGDSFEALVKYRDKNDPFYEETRLKLLDLKNTSGCEYLYTMAPLRTDTWIFVIDGSAPPDDTENFSALGDEEDTGGYDPAFNRAWLTGKTGHSRLMYQDGWGWVVSIYAPVKNSSGRVVGLVGCDFDAGDLRGAIVGGIIWQTLLALVSIAVGIVMTALFLRQIFVRLRHISLILGEIASG